MSEVHVSEKRQALIDIAINNGGNIHDYDVVDAASDPDHILHNEFEWDNNIAGPKHRLTQAQGLIKRHKVVVIKGEPTGKPIEMKVSLFSRDDLSGDGGYALTTDMLTDPTRATTLISRLERKALTLKGDIEACRGIADLDADTKWAIVSKAIDDAVKSPVSV
jgi:hypothetical protein